MLHLVDILHCLGDVSFIYCLMAADRNDLMVALLLVLRVQQSCGEGAAQALHGGEALCRGHQRPPERLM